MESNQTKRLDWTKIDLTDVPGDQTLVEELRTYQSRLGDMVASNEGDYVLISGTEVYGFFANRRDALNRSRHLFGGKMALVKRVVCAESVGD